MSSSEPHLAKRIVKNKSNSISINNSRSFERTSISQNDLLKKNSFISQRK